MFRWFNNLKIRSKLILAFLVMIALTLLVGVIALASQYNVQTTVDNLLYKDVTTNELSLRSHNAMLEARRREKDYLLRYKEFGFEEARAEYVTGVQDQVSIIRQNMAEIKQLAANAEGVANAEAIEQAATEYETTFLDTVKLIEQRGYVDEGLEGQFRDKVHEIEAFVEAENLDRLTIDMLTMRRHEKDYLLRGEETYVTQLHEAVDQFKTDVAATDLSQADQIQLTTLADEYQDLFDQLVQTDAQVDASIETYRAAVHKIEPLLAQFHQNARQAQQAADTNMQNIARTATLTVIGVSIFAVVLGMIIAFALSRTIANAVNVVAAAAEGIATGDLDQSVEVTSNDELGNMAAAFQRMIAYMRQMAAAAQSMAQGDLSVRITPQSQKDELGQAFTQMLDNLRDLVGQVQQSADQVASASLQLNASAEQAGQAGQQVASTSNQLAAGTAQQTQSVTEATGNVDQLARAAQGVARGSQEQAKSVQTTSQLVSEMADIVDEVRDVMQLISGVNGQRSGQYSVGQQVSIRARTANAVEKVKEMDARSREIGRIIETIDEIADKTDMLALNAAVEAARAGEHGRGFAVVADQVRKLSEDSKTATRDIADLIARVQGTVNDAIGAMEGTSTEVDKVAASIEQAVAQLKQKSEGVVASIESVSAVVEENTAVAEEMAANTEEVTATMENIAGIAEENSAATEEVSASAEEMSAQVEEVVASAEELSALAADLQALTQNFRLGENENLADKIDQFKQAHLRWVDRLNDMVAGRLALQESQIESHYECILGRWYYLTGKQEVGHLPEYTALEEPHAGIHEAARHAVASYNQGDRKAAEDGIKEVRRYSYEIVNLLDQLERKTHRALSMHAPSQPHPTPDRILAPAGYQGNNGSSDQT